MTRANASAPAPSASGTRPRAANGQQPMSLGLLARPSCAWQPVTEAHTLRRPASVGTGAAGRLAGRQDAGPPGYPATRPRRPRVRSTLATGLHRQLLGVPRQPLQRGEQLPPVIDSAYVVGIASGRVRRLDRQHDRCHRTSLNGAAGRWGDLGGGLVSSPSKGGDDGRGWRQGTGGVGEGRQRHS
jgi:hypothetical protein